jgi:hypothetical protein
LDRLFISAHTRTFLSRNMDSILSSPNSESRITPDFSILPPAYSVHDIPSPLCKIKTAKYLSTFVHRGIPKAEDFRGHAEYIRNLQSVSMRLLHITHVTDSLFKTWSSQDHQEQQSCDLPESVDVRYSQVSCHLIRLLRTYQHCIDQMSPLTEEDILFVLLRRFSDSSNASVYAEIRTPNNIQIYDSTIEEPMVGGIHR